MSVKKEKKNILTLNSTEAFTHIQPQRSTGFELSVAVTSQFCEGENRRHRYFVLWAVKNMNEEILTESVLKQDIWNEIRKEVDSKYYFKLM